ncbi:MAG: helix-turn-helix domain-containing protein, partial [Desulfobacteraceae bacterium]|nr:helix-turn-helix domain-containing protein [Desulfobacteraceae bacterium]
QFTKSLKKQFPKVIVKPEKLITEADGVICSGAATALFSLALYLIEKFGSKELAALTAKSMLIDPNRNSQMPYTVFDLDSFHQDRQIAKAQHWMDANYFRSITISDAAAYVGISPRHFKRRFKKATCETPLTYLQKIRVESAKKMLERTNMNINEITRKVGYEDSSTFRRLFKKYVALSPREYRDKFCTK